MGVSDVYPANIPDLFVGRAVTITGKYPGTPGDIGLTGLVNAEQRYLPIPVDPSGADHDAGTVAALPKLWARLRIADLADRRAWEADPHDELGAAIKTTALEHQLMSDYTAFAAVDSSEQTGGEYGVTVNQALPLPDGVRYDTTVESP